MRCCNKGDCLLDMRLITVKILILVKNNGVFSDFSSRLEDEDLDFIEYTFNAYYVTFLAKSKYILFCFYSFIGVDITITFIPILLFLLCYFVFQVNI